MVFNGELPTGTEAVVEAGLILEKNGLAVLVAEKAEDGEPADKPSKLLAAVVVEGAVTPVVVPPGGRPNKPTEPLAAVVAVAPKMLVVGGTVLTVLPKDTTGPDLLLSDSACANTPPAPAGIPTLDGVVKVAVLASLFSDGIPLDNKGDALVGADGALLEAAFGTLASKLPELAAPEDRIKALKMLVEPLPASPEPNALLVLPDKPRFLKNPPLLGAGAENANAAAVVAGVTTPLELAIDELAAVNCTEDCKIHQKLM